MGREARVTKWRRCRTCGTLHFTTAKELSAEARDCGAPMVRTEE